MILRMFFPVLCTLAVISGAASAQTAYAQDDVSPRRAFYFGAGTANDDGPDASDDTPLVLGFTHQPMGSKAVWGLDIAREGTMLDSTYGQDRAVEPGFSVNLLLGRNFVDSGRYRVDGALVLGVRESSQDCPDSYLGFRCYADFEPDVEYKGNFGAVATLSIDRMLIGARVTGESAQLLAGFRF